MSDLPEIDPSISPTPVTAQELQARYPYLRDVHYRLLTSVREIEDYLSGLRPDQMLFLDLETTGLHHKNDKIVGVSLCYTEREAVYIPIAHKVRAELNVPWEPVRDILNRVFSERPMGVFNWKFDGDVLEINGVNIRDRPGVQGAPIKDYWDAAASAYLSDPDAKKDLKSQVYRLLGIQQIELKEILPDLKKKGKGKTKGSRFDELDPEVGCYYACGDTDLGLRVWNLTADARSEQQFIFGVENTLADIMRRIEGLGFQLNLPYLYLIKRELEWRIKRVSDRIYAVTGKVIKKVKKKWVRVKNSELGEDKSGLIQKKNGFYHYTETVVEEPFNIASTPQVGKMFFSLPKSEGGLEIPNPHRTKKGKIKTDEATLASMRETHPILTELDNFRKLSKCLGTYVLNMIEGANEEGVGRFSFHQFGAPTGRMAADKGGPGAGFVRMNVQSTPGAVKHFASGWIIDKWIDPTLQETPCIYADPTKYGEANPTFLCQQKECKCIQEQKAEGHKEEKVEFWLTPNVRKAFIGRDEFVTVAIDYSGIELRIATNFSKEPVWLEEYKKPDPDLHLATAIGIYGPEIVNAPDKKEKRGYAKTTNFSTLFGGSGAAIARQIEGMTLEQGKAFVKKFFKALQKLEAWIHQTHLEARKNGYVRTWFKRKRRLDHPNMYGDTNPETQFKSFGFGDRSSVSTTIQGTAADVMKIALLRLDSKIRSAGLSNDVHVLLTIHDECVMEVRLSKLFEVVPILVKAMEFEVKGWEVPLVCDIEIGPSWGEGVEHRLEQGQLHLAEGLLEKLQAGIPPVIIPPYLPAEVQDLPELYVDGEDSEDLEERGEDSEEKEEREESAEEPQEEPEETSLEATPTVGGPVQVAPAAERPPTVEPKIDPSEAVLLVFHSLRTRANLVKLRSLIEECPGNSSLIIRFAGVQEKCGIPEKVNPIKLLQRAVEESLQLTIEPWAV